MQHFIFVFHWAQQFHLYMPCILSKNRSSLRQNWILNFLKRGQSIVKQKQMNSHVQLAHAKHSQDALLLILKYSGKAFYFLASVSFLKASLTTRTNISISSAET